MVVFIRCWVSSITLSAEASTALLNVVFMLHWFFMVTFERIRNTSMNNVKPFRIQRSVLLILYFLCKIVILFIIFVRKSPNLTGVNVFMTCFYFVSMIDFSNKNKAHLNMFTLSLLD